MYVENLLFVGKLYKWISCTVLALIGMDALFFVGSAFMRKTQNHFINRNWLKSDLENLTEQKTSYKAQIDILKNRIKELEAENKELKN